MSKFINVRGLKENNDPSYRYKMPSLCINTQKTKMIITNIKEIADSLDRDPVIIVDFLKKKFSTAIKYDPNENKVEFKSIEPAQIHEAIYEFIEYFVLCPTCKNPETVISNGKKNLYMQCKACSHYDKVPINNKLIEKVYDTYIKIIKESTK